MSLRRSPPGPGHAAGDRGFVLPIAVIVSMVVIVSAVTLAGRGLGGLLGSVRSNSGSEARDAAEAGIDLIISRLNQPQNRQLMVAAVPISQWGSNNPQLRNPCQPESSTSISSSNFGISGGHETLPGSGNRKFRLLRLTVRGPAGSGASYSSSGAGGSSSGGYSARLINLADRNNTGELDLEVEGISEGGSSSGARVQLKRTFELVPKQCGRSFGRSADDINQPVPAAGLWSHGNDFRYSTTFPGLVVGLNGGGITSSSSASDLVLLGNSGNADVNIQPLNLFCRVASDTTGCATANLDGVPLVASSVPADGTTTVAGGIPGWTATDSSAPCSGTAAGQPSPPRCIGKGGATDYIRINSTGTGVEKVNVSTGASTPLPNACRPLSGPAPFHCRVSDLDTIPYVIDTTRGPIYLYYGSPWTTSPYNSNLNIKHVYCSGTSASSACTIPATGANIARAGIISLHPASSSFTLSPSDSANCLSSSGTGGLRDLLVWLPTGELSLTNGCFRGAAFVNNLKLAGNSTLAVADPLKADGSWLGSSLSSTDPLSAPLRRLGMVIYEVVARRSTGTGLVNR